MFSGWISAHNCTSCSLYMKVNLSSEFTLLWSILLLLSFSLLFYSRHLFQGFSSFDLIFESKRPLPVPWHLLSACRLHFVAYEFHCENVLALFLFVFRVHRTLNSNGHTLNFDENYLILLIRLFCTSFLFRATLPQARQFVFPVVSTRHLTLPIRWLDSATEACPDCKVARILSDFSSRKFQKKS